MADLKTCIKIGELSKEVKRIQYWVDEHIKDRDDALTELNRLLVNEGGRALTLEEVLSIED